MLLYHKIYVRKEEFWAATKTVCVVLKLFSNGHQKLRLRSKNINYRFSDEQQAATGIIKIGNLQLPLQDNIPEGYLPEKMFPRDEQ